MVLVVLKREMKFCNFTILIIICNLCYSECRTVTYNNKDLMNHRIQRNQSRKVKENINIPNQDTIGSNLTKIARPNKTKFKYRILKPRFTHSKSKLRFPIKKKNSLYTTAIFKDNKLKENSPLHTLAIFEPNPDSSGVVLSNPLNINLPETEDQFILPELDEDTREGEVFLNNVAFDNWASFGENANTYQVDESLNQEYHSINENDINSVFANDSYFPDSSYHQLNEVQYEDNFSGYPESHQLTSTTEHSGYFYGYSYQPPSYLPPEENGIVLYESSDVESASNGTKAVKIKEHDLFSHYYIGYKLWYVALVFGIYHAIMVIFFLLTILSKHYSRFPAALHAAAANSYNS